jgi:hypothetical protein
VILQGSIFFNAVINDIESILGIKMDISDTWAEGLLYVSDKAFKLSKGLDVDDENHEITDAVSKINPELHYDFSNHKMEGEIEYENLDIKYPDLVKVIFAVNNR